MREVESSSPKPDQHSGRKIIEENVLPSLILPNMIRDLVFSNKDEKP